MISRDQAIAKVRDRLPADYDILKIIELDYGWLIFSQTKDYINSKNMLDMAIGSGGTLVNKNNGRIIEFGSAYAMEINLKIYEAGYFDYDDFDLVIVAISDQEQAIQHITALEISYVKPEVVNGETWRIPKFYTKPQLRERLNCLPCRFNLGNLYFKWKLLEQLKHSGAVTIELEPNSGFRNSPFESSR